jgi:hypothetical protein
VRTSSSLNTLQEQMIMGAVVRTDALEVRDFVTDCKRKTQNCNHSNLVRQSDRQEGDVPARNGVGTTSAAGTFRELADPMNGQITAR